MKTERIIYWILLILLIGSNVYFLIQHKSNTENKNESGITENSTINKSLFENIIDIADASSGSIVNKDMELVAYNGKTMLLHDIVKSPPVLVFDFEKINCKTCVEDEMERLIHISKELGKEKVIFVSRFNNSREQYVLEKNYDVQILNLANNSFGLPIENEGVPFVFVIDSGYVAKDFYVPTQAFFGLGNIYYSLLLSKYFE